MPEPERLDFRYWAFISYAHADKPAAERLHRRLETYKLPVNLTPIPGDSIAPLPKRLFPVFRDIDDAEVRGTLSEMLQKALRESRAVVVVCSPRSAQSVWVSEEVRYFRQLGRGDRIFCFVIDGEPGISLKGGDAARECFPAPLLEVPAALPLAADARPEADGPARATIRLVAALVGVRFDDLVQRDQARRRRWIATVAAATGAAAILVTGLLSQWWFERGRAADEYQARMLNAVRQDLQDSDVAAALAGLGTLATAVGDQRRAPLHAAMALVGARLEPLPAVLDRLDKPTVFEWRKRSYLATKHGTHLIAGEAVKTFGVDVESGHLIVGRVDQSIAVLDVDTGRLLYDTGPVQGIDFRTEILRGDDGTYAVMASTQELSAGMIAAAVVLVDARQRSYASVKGGVAAFFKVDPGCQFFGYDDYSREPTAHRAFRLRLEAGQAAVPPAAPDISGWKERHYGGLDDDPCRARVLTGSPQLAGDDNVIDEATWTHQLKFPAEVGEDSFWREVPDGAPGLQSIEIPPENFERLAGQGQVELLGATRWSSPLSIGPRRLRFASRADGSKFGYLFFCEFDPADQPRECVSYRFLGNFGALTLGARRRFALVSDNKYYGQQSFVVIDLAHLRLTTISETPQGAGPTSNFVDFAPDETSFAMLTESGEVLVYRLADGDGFQVAQRFFSTALPRRLGRDDASRGPPDNGKVPHVAGLVLVDDRTLVALRADGSLVSLDLTTRFEKWRLGSSGDEPIGLFRSPSGAFVAVATASGIRLVDARLGLPLSDYWRPDGTERLDLDEIGKAGGRMGFRVLSPWLMAIEVGDDGSVEARLGDKLYRRELKAEPVRGRQFGAAIPALTGLDPAQGNQPFDRLPTSR